jgi:hypothetical protein
LNLIIINTVIGKPSSQGIEIKAPLTSRRVTMPQMQNILSLLAIFLALSIETAAHPRSLAPENGNLVARQDAEFFQPFTGGECDGTGGPTSTIEGLGGSGCIGIDSDKHSFRVSGGACARINILLFDNSDCNGEPSVVEAGDGQCLNVNTGASWGGARFYCF